MIFLIAFLLNFNMVSSLANETRCAQLSNDVYFSKNEDDQGEYEMINFKLTVYNYCGEAIPDLGVTNRSKYVKFFINGEEDNPMSLSNGEEWLEGDRTIASSQFFVHSWSLKDDSGIWMRGESFEVQWQYIEFYSPIVQVDLKHRAITHLRLND